MPENFRYCRWGAERRVPCARTRERGPPSAAVEFFDFSLFHVIVKLFKDESSASAVGINGRKSGRICKESRRICAVSRQICQRKIMPSTMATTFVPRATHALGSFGKDERETHRFSGTHFGRITFISKIPTTNLDHLLPFSA